MTTSPTPLPAIGVRCRLIPEGSQGAGAPKVSSGLDQLQRCSGLGFDVGDLSLLLGLQGDLLFSIGLLDPGAAQRRDRSQWRPDARRASDWRGLEQAPFSIRFRSREPIGELLQTPGGLCGLLQEFVPVVGWMAAGQHGLEHPVGVGLAAVGPLGADVVHPAQHDQP